MRYTSLFSGIEAASVAWLPLGWKPLAFSEIEPFPKAVLANHYPNIPDLGDITKIDWSQYAGSADIVVGGSPCQSFSVAGSRTGLDGASGLMWEYVRAVQAIRPEWFVWDNVPGALTSSHGEDFRCLLASMDELGYGLAWRVLDAQFYGVAQRRRRVFLVGHLGDQRAAEVLFEPESLCWDTPSSREKRETLTRGTASDAGITVGSVWYASDSGSNSAVGKDIAPTITVHDSRSASYVVRMRSGKPGGGKGALVSKELSLTIATGNDQTLFASRAARRLTPRECERLQGFPDDWTDIPYRGKPHAPDSVRYKALGNSMAVPVMQWIGRRIKEASS